MQFCSFEKEINKVKKLLGDQNFGTQSGILVSQMPGIHRCIWSEFYKSQFYLSFILPKAI